jgi:hypothetical protein
MLAANSVFSLVLAFLRSLCESPFPWDSVVFSFCPLNRENQALRGALTINPWYLGSCLVDNSVFEIYLFR